MLGALILFALVFTAGASYFEVVNNYKHTVDLADSGRMAFLQQASSENLSIIATSYAPTGDLYLSVSNVGGVPSTIVGTFVTANNGTIISRSAVNPTSHFLSAQGDLSFALPITLGVGANTSQLTGCPQGNPGCDIGITLSSSGYSAKMGTVVISVLTSLGNVFSVKYPTVIVTHTTTTTTATRTSITTTTSISTSLVNILNESGVVGCYGCTLGLASGGNILVTLITASPSPVQNGGTISVVATVWNYSPYSAAGVNVTLRTFYSGSATVSPDGSSSAVACGIPTSILPEQSAAFSCSFSANTGGSMGTVTFVGSATGCIVTGTTLTCSNGESASSSVSSSNAVQVGSLVSIGLWQLNYYQFSFTASSSTTPSPASIIPHTDTYVAFDVQVTNIYNQSMTLLSGSYIQFVSPGTDVDAYIIQNGTLSYTTKTFTAYGCTDGPPAAPTDSVSGSHCLTVGSGKSINLVFAASSAGGTGWEWGNANYPGGSSVGNTVDIILEYALSSGGVYVLHAENIPFQSVFIS